MNDENAPDERLFQAIGGPGRMREKTSEKTWDECSIEQKIERLRDELRSMRRVANHAQATADELGRHQHSVLGEIVVPLHHKGSFGESRSFDPLA